MSYSKGVCWVADCRIPFVDEEENTIRNTYDTSVELYGWINHKGQMGSFDDSAKQGRFTPNLLVCDDMLNDGSVSEAGKYKGEGSKSGGIWNSSTGKPAGKEYGDKGSNSRYYDLDLWFDKLINNINDEL